MTVPASSQAMSAHQLDPAGLGVDLDDGDVGAERERRARGVEAGVDRQLARRWPWPRTARSAHDLDTAGVPATWNAPDSMSSSMSASAASSAWAASFLAGLGELDGGLVDGRAALLQRARAHRAVADGRQVGVAPHERELVDRDAGLGAGDHRPRGVVALAVRRRAGVDGGRAVVVDLDLGVLAVADAAGDLDVDRHADAELHRVAGLAPAPSARRAAGRSRRPRAPGRASRRSRRRRRSGR